MSDNTGGDLFETAAKGDAPQENAAKAKPLRDAHGHFVKKDAKTNPPGNTKGGKKSRPTPKKPTSKAKDDGGIREVRLGAALSPEMLGSLITDFVDSMSDNLGMMVEDVSIRSHRHGFVSGFAWGAIVTAIVGIATFFIAR